ncbi:ubiquinol-cytochrome c reductase iron-sulfur subunit [Bradyrhizobium sp. WSM3983]|uniref:QcrA and Rieske domain-containing protein n=1 Tax=Bradyrhizobium sp. WSM3983 TaxID=1038867 RepID=UPI00040F92E5|nr:Rieske 2Fe-2S domain-containing protein [Bradyrhizobium sp. WSM3983]
MLLLGALATTACLGCSAQARAGEDPPGSDERPQKGDVLVFSEGDSEGKLITADLQAGGPPVHAWPQDPKTSVVRNASRLNEILIIQLDPAELDEQTKARAVDGILAYSAICSHAGCPVTAWVKSDVGDKDVLKCMCHGSVTATAGDLVFAGGTNDRNFRAFNAKTGELLWEQKTNSCIMGTPMSYEIDGTQYVAIQSGWGVDAQRIPDALATNNIGIESNVPQGGVIWVFALKK